MPLLSPRFAANARLQAAAENNPPLKKGETGDADGQVDHRAERDALAGLGILVDDVTGPAGGRARDLA